MWHYLCFSLKGFDIQCFCLLAWHPLCPQTFTHFPPFTVWLLTSLPNMPLPQTCSSIIRPELIAMHFTAEVRKPYPWISTMYPPPAYPHTSVPSPPSNLTVPLPLLSPETEPRVTTPPQPRPPHRQTIDQIRKVPITVLTAGAVGSRVASGQSLSITWPPLCTQTHCELPPGGKWIHMTHYPGCIFSC